MVARLTKKFGSEHVEAILDAVQESFVTALGSWPHHGTPNNQSGWLMKVAERRLIDTLRQTGRDAVMDEDNIIASRVEASEIGLYVMVCSPKLTIREQVCLALRTLAGLTSADIARLLLESEEAVQRRITRSKEKLSVEDLTLRNPEEHLPSILTVLYLMFTEGYEAGRGDEYVRPELAYSALRLGEELRSLLSNQCAELEALLALMHFHCARMPARVSQEGEMIFWEEQDPAQINQAHTRRGFDYLALAQSTKLLSRFHLEAGLAAAIVRGAGTGEVLEWHSMLAKFYPTPLNQIAFVISVGEHEGAERGLEGLRSLPDEIKIARPAHYASAMAFFLTKLGRKTEAREWYRRAMANAMSAPVKRGLERRLEELGD
ncbi:MAG: DUF6596 domain-containing protein [Armatimonadota bacterium]